MGGGIKLSTNGWHYLIYTERTPTNDDATREKVRSLKDPSVMNTGSDWVIGSPIRSRRCPHTCYSTDPKRTRGAAPNSARTCNERVAVNGSRVCDDDEDLPKVRLRNNNLVGPAGPLAE